MTEYNIHTIKDETIGYPPTIRRTREASVSDEIPTGAVSIADLRDAEIRRAESARRHASSAIGSLFTRESALIPQTRLTDLLDSLPGGSIAYEEIPPVEQVRQA